MRRRERITASRAVTILAGAALTAALALPASAGASSASFTTPGGPYQFKVPFGVSSIKATAVGGAGGMGASFGGKPGRGALIEAELPVKAGEILFVYVAGNGGSGLKGGAGGVNGGGAGGEGLTAGGGGGASDIRTAEGDLSSRILVAGGGGGSTFEFDGADEGAAAEGVCCLFPQPGTATEGGKGGKAGLDPRLGGNGEFGVGGAGAPNPEAHAPGAGGGGGWYGGGGGAPRDAGAGGSSYSEPSARVLQAATPTSASAGVTVSYTSVATKITLKVEPSAIAAGKGQATATATVTDGAGAGLAGDKVKITSSDGSESIGAVTDHGDGTYTATIKADSAIGSSTITAVDESVSPNLSAEATLRQVGPPSARVEEPSGGGYYAIGQSVATKFSCEEAAFGPGIESCTDEQGALSLAGGVLDTSGTGEHSYTVTARSLDGSSATAGIRYTVAAPPTAEIYGFTSAENKTFPLNSQVPVRVTCKEGSYGPGLESCAGSQENEPIVYIDTSKPGSSSYTAIVRSKDGQTGEATVEYRDAEAPTVKIEPATGGKYAQGEHVATSFTCTEGLGGPGIETCGGFSGDHGNGELDTSKSGRHLYRVETVSKDGFTGSAYIRYEVTPGPAITKVSPESGPQGGKTSVTITGVGFSQVQSVHFGKAAANYSVISENTITAASPPGTGTVDITVTTATNTTPIVAADRFSYFPPPSVSTGEASEVGGGTAVLNATVNPNGGEVTSCKLEYGRTTVYSSSVPCKPAPGSGGEAVAVSASVSGLAPHTPYHFRVSAANASGLSKGKDASFTTTRGHAPEARTIAAAEVGSTTAVLRASVDPWGLSTIDCRFEYGTTSRYGTIVPCSARPAAVEALTEVKAPVKRLRPATIYHYRVVLSTLAGTARGNDEQLKTP